MLNKNSTIIAALVVCGTAAAALWFAPVLLLPHKVESVTGPAFVQTQKLTNFQKSILGDLDRQCRTKIWYQDGYYSGGEPPPKIGVCTDVVVRSYRAAGVDLQKLLQQDIAQAPGSYSVSRPDVNIDHRRCRNLAVFFKRHGRKLPTERVKADWEPGDIVFWDTREDGRPDHIGVIADGTDSDGNPTVVHHWPGTYVTETDWLYRLPVLYHFRYPASRHGVGRST